MVSLKKKCHKLVIFRYFSHFKEGVLRDSVFFLFFHESSSRNRYFKVEYTKTVNKNINDYNCVIGLQ